MLITFLKFLSQSFVKIVANPTNNSFSLVLFLIKRIKHCPYCMIHNKVRFLTCCPNKYIKFLNKTCIKDI